MTKRRAALVRALAPLLLTALVLGACSGDDDGDAATTTTEDGRSETTEAGDEGEDEGEGNDADDDADVAEGFCRDYLDIEATIATGPRQLAPDASTEEQQAAVDDFSDELLPKLEQLEDDAPEEIQREIGTLTEIVRSVLAGERASSFPLDEDYRKADTAVDAWLVDSCGYEVSEVTGVEYAFEGAPEQVSAGPVGFTFTNDGEEVHELLLFSIEDEEVPIQDLLLQERPEGVDFVLGVIATQGTTDTVFRDLEPGRYAMVCTLPVGSTEAPSGPPSEQSGPPHFTQGMLTELTVTP